MADELDAWLASLDAPAAPAPPPVDMGPGSRRAATLRPPGPRELTDEQAGEGTGPLYTDRFHSRDGKSVVSQFRPGTTDPMEADPIAQNVVGGVLAGGAGKLVAPIFGKLAGGLGASLGPAAARVATGGVEGEVANDVMGGRPGEGALIGSAVSVPGAALGVIHGAPARVDARTMKNLTEPEGVTGKVSRQVEAKAGEHGETLREVIDNHPELRKSLALQAVHHPGKALATVEATMDKLDGKINGDFGAMQAHAATIPPSSQATVAQMLDQVDALAAKHRGDFDKTAAIGRAREAIVRDFGSDPGTVITPMELRKMRQSIGRAAFSGDPMTAATVKAEVTRELYGPINRQIENIASMTPGVDLAAFKAANRDISVLIPVSQSLEQQSIRMATGRENILQKGKEVVEKMMYAAGGLGATHLLPGGVMEHGGVALAAGLGAMGIRVGARMADYYLAQILRDRAAGTVPVSALQEAVRAGVPIQTAIAAARGDTPRLHLPELGGHASTPLSSPLPPSPAHLANQVFAQ